MLYDDIVYVWYDKCVTFAIAILRVIIGVANASAFWMVAYTYEAIACSIIMAVCGIYTTWHCIKITNQFHWDENMEDWDTRLINRLNLKQDNINHSSTPDNPVQSNKKQDGNFMKTSNYLDKSIRNADAIGNDNHNDSKSVTTATAAEDEEEEDDSFEGYMLVHEPSQGIFKSSSWERYYFVLSDNCVWYYKDKYAWESAPDKPIKTRPIVLENYTVNSTANQQKELAFTLKMKESSTILIWDFKCDTIEEYNVWVHLLTLACNL